MFGRTGTTIALISLLSLWCQVHSQVKNEKVFVNGPTGISVDALDDKQKASNSNAPVVNGPMGISVDALDDKQRASKSQGPSDDALEDKQKESNSQESFINGPTGYSVEAEEQRKKQKSNGFEEVEEDLKYPDDSTGPEFVESDVDLQALDNDEDKRQFVNGHSGSSVKQLQLNADAASEVEEARGVISTEPKEDKKTKLPEGHHVHTTDWSTDTSQWTFKGGEWSLVSLPDKENHPNLPPDIVPSPALVVVTTDPLAKVHASRVIEGLEKVTLHFRYYLSEGESPSGIPELDVYQVKDDHTTSLVTSGTSHGTWDAASVPLPLSGDSKIVFIGQRKQHGNEIAIDDITISGYGRDAGKIEDVEQSENETTVRVNEDGTTTESPSTKGESDGVTTAAGGNEGTTGNVVESTQSQAIASEKTDDGQVSVSGTEQPNEDEQTTKAPEKSEVTVQDSGNEAQGNDTVGAVGKSEDSDLIVTTYSPDDKEFYTDLEQDNETLISKSTEGLLQDNDTFSTTDNHLMLMPKKDGNFTDVENENVSVSVNSDDDVTTQAMNGSFPGTVSEVSQVNLTTQSSEISDSEDYGGGNNTEISVISTLPSNLGGITTNNNDGNDTNTTNNNVAITTPSPETIGTEPNMLVNQTDQGITVNQANATETSISVNVTGEGALTTVNISPTNITEGVYKPSESATSSLQDNTTNSYNKTTLMPLTSTSSPGGNNTSPGNGNIQGNGTDTSGNGNSSDNDSSWSTFKLFLVITLLGVAVLGFLYWRRQRRRDDEIPVFSRATHSDYHNPTFEDDDSNFASKGTSRNYKSFN